MASSSRCLIAKASARVALALSNAAEKGATAESPNSLRARSSSSWLPAIALSVSTRISFARSSSVGSGSALRLAMSSGEMFFAASTLALFLSFLRLREYRTTPPVPTTTAPPAMRSVPTPIPPLVLFASPSAPAAAIAAPVQSSSARAGSTASVLIDSMSESVMLLSSAGTSR